MSEILGPTEKFIEIYGTCGEKLDEDTWLCWMGVWQIAWQEAQNDQSQLIEVCEEIARKPYSDSDPISLLEALRARAEAVLSRFNEQTVRP